MTKVATKTRTTLKEAIDLLQKYKSDFAVIEFYERAQVYGSDTFYVLTDAASLKPMCYSEFYGMGAFKENDKLNADNEKAMAKIYEVAQGEYCLDDFKEIVELASCAVSATYIGF